MAKAETTRESAMLAGAQDYINMSQALSALEYDSFTPDPDIEGDDGLRKQYTKADHAVFTAITKALGVKRFDARATGFLRAMVNEKLVQHTESCLPKTETWDAEWALTDGGMRHALPGEAVTGDPERATSSKPKRQRSGPADRDEDELRCLGIDALVQIEDLIETAKHQLATMEPCAEVSVLLAVLARISDVSEAICGVIDRDTADSLRDLQRTVYGRAFVEQEVSHG